MRSFPIYMTLLAATSCQNESEINRERSLEYDLFVASVRAEIDGDLKYYTTDSVKPLFAVLDISCEYGEIIAHDVKDNSKNFWFTSVRGEIKFCDDPDRNYKNIGVYCQNLWTDLDARLGRNPKAND